jgi:hypothetical protein
VNGNFTQFFLWMNAALGLPLHADELRVKY